MYVSVNNTNRVIRIEEDFIMLHNQIVKNFLAFLKDTFIHKDSHLE